MPWDRSGFEQLFAAEPGTPLRLDAERVFWRASAGAGAALLTVPEAAVLSQCGPFRSRAAHVEHATRQAGLAPATVEAHLERLIALGALRAAASWLPPDEAPAAAAPAPLLVVRSAARPAALGALLDSLRAEERRWDARYDIVVVEDSADAALAAGTRSVALEFARASRSRVRWLGPDERPALLDWLLDGLAAADAAAARGLLDAAHLPSRAGGRSWNWAVLLSAGGTLGLLDDDFRLPLRLPPDAEPGTLQLLNSLDCDTGFFDAPDGPEALPVLDAEPFAWLVAALGQPVGALLAAYPPRAAALAGLSPHSLVHLRAGARVSAVFTGIYGAFAFDSADFLLAPIPATWRGLMREPYRHERLNGDRVVHAVRQPRLVSQGVFTPLAIDNRDPLPGTVTLGKQDDTLFLRLCKIARPDTVLLAAPLAVGHWPVEPRDRIARARAGAITDLNHLVALPSVELVAQLRSDDPAARLAALGALYAELARAGDARLAELVLRWRDGLASGVAQTARAALALAGPGAPAPWREFAEAVAIANERRLLDRTVAPSLLAAARAGFGQAAALLALWPVLWQRAAGGALLARVPRLA